MDPITLDLVAIVVSMLVGLAIPWLTEAVTHLSAPDWIRSLLNAALSAAAGALTTVSLADHATVTAYLLAMAAAWVGTMRATYAGLAEPVKSQTRSVGIGRIR